MIKIGVLGDIGSGKSFVAKQFGCPVFDADKEVSLIMNRDPFVIKEDLLCTEALSLMNNNSITDEGIKDMKYMQTLNLMNNNSITYEGIKNMKNLKIIR